MNIKILFVGAINRFAPPANGEEYKNQMLLGFLDERYKVHVIDTKTWSKEPLTLVKLLFHMIFVTYDKIIISASSASVFRLLDTLRFFKKRMRKVIYFVIGGYLPKAIAARKYKNRAYQSISSLVVEGEIMKKELMAHGITAPIHVVPNFKSVKKCWGNTGKFDCAETRFVFVSRIAESKGIDTIFQAISDARISAYHQKFTIDFYGPIEKGYEQTFNELISKYPMCNYRSYLDFTNHPDQSYDRLSNYHVMLFPTYWVGEGFPGAIIDALMCGLPVIASDWNMNREVVEHQSTGMLIPVKDSNSLMIAMIDVMEHHDEWKKMSTESYRRAAYFDTDFVLNKYLKDII